jgi:hypothetical protein
MRNTGFPGRRRRSLAARWTVIHELRARTAASGRRRSPRAGRRPARHVLRGDVAVENCATAHRSPEPRAETIRQERYASVGLGSGYCCGAATGKLDRSISPPFRSAVPFRPVPACTGRRAGQRHVKPWTFCRVASERSELEGVDLLFSMYSHVRVRGSHCTYTYTSTAPAASIQRRVDHAGNAAGKWVKMNEHARRIVRTRGGEDTAGSRRRPGVSSLAAAGGCKARSTGWDRSQTCTPAEFPSCYRACCSYTRPRPRTSPVRCVLAVCLVMRRPKPARKCSYI